MLRFGNIFRATPLFLYLTDRCKHHLKGDARGIDPHLAAADVAEMHFTVLWRGASPHAGQVDQPRLVPRTG